ncbi:MAG: translocation/assembly module TamB domain-containing protein [Balneolales bacterium]|nr:translocation/assembly module TamB domain-containing protein [Balneolales bacterium]
MILKWVYTIWRYFWTAFFALLMIVSFVFGMVLLLLQLSAVQQWVADGITDRFNERFEGNITIGSVRGTLPLELELSDVTLTLPLNDASGGDIGENLADTLLSTSQLYIRLDLQRTLFDRLTISSIRIEKPEIRLAFEPDQPPGLARAFRLKNPDQADSVHTAVSGRASLAADLPRIYLQDLTLNGGRINLSGLSNTGIDTTVVNLPDAFSAEDLQISLNLELFEDQRLLAFRELRFRSDALPFEELLFRGQLYTDERFLEFNRITLQTPQSLLRFNLIFEGVNAAMPDLTEQLKSASFQFRVDESRVLTDEFRPLFPALPVLGKALEVGLQARGSLGEAELSRFSLRFGDSSLQLYGEASGLSGPFAYAAVIDYLNVTSDDLDLLFAEVGPFRLRELELFTLRGEVSGTLSELDAELRAESAAGELLLRSSANWASLPVYDTQLEVRNLRFSRLPSMQMGNSVLNFAVNATGSGSTLANGKGKLEAALTNSRITDLQLDDVLLKLELKDGFLEPDLLVRQPEGGELSLRGWLDLISEQPLLNLEGRLSGFRPELTLLDEQILPGLLNSDITLVIQGSDADSFVGEVYLNLISSVYGDENIDEFEFFVTLEEDAAAVSADQGSPHRLLRIGGTMLEAEIRGRLIPSELLAVTEYWYQQIDRLITERSLYQLSDAAPVSARQLSRHAAQMPAQQLNIKMQLDDLSLLHALFPAVPRINTLSNLDATVTADGSSVQFRSSFFSDFIDAEAVTADSVVSRLSFSIRPDAEAGFFSGLLQLDAASIGTRNGQQLRDASLMLDMYDEAFVLQHLRLVTGDDVMLGAMASAVFTNRDVDIRLMDFFVGDEAYTWSNIRQTPIRIFDGGQIFVDRLEFGNQEERFIIEGTFSEDPDDVVYYNISGLQLERISALINRRVSFSGTLDGSFETRTIGSDPGFRGGFQVDRLRLNERLVGDITFNSSFNALLERFDTILTVQAQPDDISEEEAGGPFFTDDLVVKDVVVEGFFNTLASARETGVYASFDVRLNEIDLWVLPLIVSNVFEEVEGRARGNGVFEWGEEGMYFDSRFELIDIELVPVFLMTRLVLNGNIDFSSERGVEINNVRVRDTRNGRGTLSGVVDLNNFTGPTLFNLQLQMNNLTFLNNQAGPDVPFFGRGQGTGIVRLSGSNDDPFISTPQPIVMSGNSIISIPISTDQSVEGGTRFIQFVDEFDFSRLFLPPDPENGGNGQNGREVNLTFMEKFGLDLQFVANDNMTVRLIFDEVTSEILSARGTGRIRLGLQDEVFQVFGSFDVASGDYLFVGGDIFSRRFTLRDGGTITWDGDPINAMIDVSASYRARPNINVLRPGTTIDDVPVRIPVDLVLVITGTLDSIENDFFFEFPTGTDITQIAAIQAALDNEDTKLLQATSILLSGNFVPLDSELNSVFANQFGAQGLSMLLSSQISSLLNSNISNLDIDLNLTGFDEADLGIALRLFDDRLTVRREGTVTGPDSHWGDFDVTYRFNRYFSIEAFLRRESLLPSAISVGRDQNDEVYGIGLEARVQFNTWGELRDRIWGSVRRLFGLRDADESAASENDPDNQPLSYFPAAATEARTETRPASRRVHP